MKIRQTKFSMYKFGGFVFPFGQLVEVPDNFFKNMPENVQKIFSVVAEEKKVKNKENNGG